MQVNRAGAYSSIHTREVNPAETGTDKTKAHKEVDTAPVFEPRQRPPLTGKADRPKPLAETIIGAPHANSSTTKPATLKSQKEASQGLSDALLEFSKKSGPKLFQHRPPELKAALDLLSPLQEKTKFSRREQLVLIDASLMLGKLSPATLAKNPSINKLIDQIHSFTPSARELTQALSQSAAQLERHAKVPSFSQFLLDNHPEMIAAGGNSNTLQLTQKGRERYKVLKQDFDLTALDRHVIPASGTHLSERDVAVTKLIEGGYKTYQSALRNPDDSIKTRRALLECAEIVTQLAKAKPEEVKKDRIASVFPGGITDPSKLEPGKSYKEEGFVFVGGERPSDQGHHMMIKMAKGYAVDARRYYGHSMNNEDKLQWISLPGAHFRFDGVSSGNNKKTYMFSQVSR